VEELGWQDVQKSTTGRRRSSAKTGDAHGWRRGLTGGEDRNERAEKVGGKRVGNTKSRGSYEHEGQKGKS